MEKGLSNVIYIWGITMWGLAYSFKFVESGKKVYFVDNNSTKWNKKIINGFRCINPNDIDSRFEVVVSVRSSSNQNAILAQLASLGCEKVSILSEEMDEWLLNMNDHDYLKCLCYIRMNRDVEIDYPLTFNEKIQWLKLHDRNPRYTDLVDKYKVKAIVDATLGEGYTIPTVGVWDCFDDIDFDRMPDKFVLKCTHDSGSIIICTDKQTFDKEYARKKLETALQTNYYFSAREWTYKNVIPKIIAEPYMGGRGNTLENGLDDYKFMCFGGKVKCVFTCTERNSDTGLKVTFFDLDWNRLPFERHYPADMGKRIEKPYSFDKMLEFSEKISKDIPFVRVDFYEIGRKPYFGEMTFYPGAGMEEFFPAEWDTILGSWITLPDSPLD